MKYLLDPPGRAELARFAQRNTLVGLDYDGTLAPIVARPDLAEMRPRTRELLMQVSRQYPLVVMTGRSRASALQFLRGVPVLELIGNHGLEVQGTMGDRFVQRVAQWRARLTGSLRTLAGVAIEDKRYSLAVHYRNAQDPPSALKRIVEEVAGLDGARILGGKKVVNVLPREAPDKGAALLGVLGRLGCPRAIYVGDDDTDEDVFALERPEQVLTVRVGRLDRSRATYFLEDQAEVDAFLALLRDLAGAQLPDATGKG